MNKAFIFDMDGVLVNSESTWEVLEKQNMPQLFGHSVAGKMGNLVGIGLIGLMERAESLGAKFDRKEVARKFDDIAIQVYSQSPLTEGIDRLAEKLVSLDIAIGLVSQSPHSYINQVVSRLPFRDKLAVIVSLHEHPELRRKPEPDGFLYAFKQLDASPEESYVLEDSSFGIRAGKASGAFTIGFRGNLLPGYEQDGADAYAYTMEDVIALIDRTG